MIEMTRVMLSVEADMLDMVRVETERPNMLEMKMMMIVMDKVMDMQWVVGGRPKKLDMARVGTERPNILEEMIVMDRVLDMQWVVRGRPKKLVVMAKMVCQGLLEISVQIMLMVSIVTWTPPPKASMRVGDGMLDMQRVLVVRLELPMTGTGKYMMLGKNRD